MYTQLSKLNDQWHNIKFQDLTRNRYKTLKSGHCDLDRDMKIWGRFHINITKWSGITVLIWGSWFLEYTLTDKGCKIISQIGAS